MNVSQVRRLRRSDRIFFLSVNRRPKIRHFTDSEFLLLIGVLAASRQRLKFLLCGYVLMRDHWHALVWPSYPMLISDVLHDVKKVSAGKFHARRGSRGPLWQHPLWDRFVRNEREFRLRLEYMHFNRVRMGLAKEPQDWLWPATTGHGRPHTAEARASQRGRL